MKNRRLRAGDPVRVRSPEEILSTLDVEGTLDGVPFMPEMLDWCGKPFHVYRRVEKTCVDGYPVRRFPADDVVILDGPRCDGGGHDGCKHACRIFWKQAWLCPMDATAASAPEISAAGIEKLRARLKVKSDERHYFCQSTQLYKATASFPGVRRLLTLRIVWREVRSGDLSTVEVLRLLARWFTQKGLRALGADEWLSGSCTRTPAESLGLKAGEAVRIKSRAEITQTLDRNKRNRGMGICFEMTKCCGREAEVRHRIDRLIDERTGEMREIFNTVALQNLRPGKGIGEECLCEWQLGDCPRGELMFWREIWLERI